MKGRTHPFVGLVPERWRWAHRWFAYAAYYAWQPCPLCNKPFGGHEWRDIDGKPSVIPNPASQWWGSLGICPTCTRQGRGDDINRSHSTITRRSLMISVELKLTPYDEPKLGLNIKTTTSLTVITGEKEAFLRICARAWDQHHGETPAVPEGSTYDR